MDGLGIKLELSRLLFDKDALHIYAALAIQIVAAKLPRRSLGYVLPWLTALRFELVNEIIDIVRGGEARLMPWQTVSAVHDIVKRLSCRQSC